MLTLRELLSNKRFIIPLYQRGYSWTPYNIDAMSEDLLLAEKLGKDHFFGPIVWTTLEVGEHGAKRIRDRGALQEHVLVHDGQQRLVSFLLHLRSLYVRLEELNQAQSLEFADLGRHLYIRVDPGQGDAGTQSGHLSRLTYENRAFDEALQFVLGLRSDKPLAMAEPIRRLYSAWDHARRKFASESLEACIMWSQKLLHRTMLQIIDLNVKKLDPNITFEAINARGLPLGQFDKIKNFSMLAQERSSPAEAESDSAASHWYKSIELLDKYGAGRREAEEDYVSEMYSVFHNNRVSEANTHRAFTKQYHSVVHDDTPDPETVRDLNDFIRFWQRYAQAFGLFVSPDRTSFLRIEKRADNTGLRWLDCLENMDLQTITRPLLVASLMNFAIQDFALMARACEIYTFRMHAVLRKRKDANSTVIVRLANEIALKTINAASAVERIGKWLEEQAPMDAVLLELGNRATKYNHDPKQSGWSHCYYFLYEYDVSVSPKHAVRLKFEKNDKQRSSQEHILPQDSRAPGWIRVWPDELKAARHVHRLGNLVLSKGNSALGNKPFHLKLNDPKATYSYKSDSATNSEKKLGEYCSRDASGLEIWTEESIDLREAALLEFAKARWTL